MDWCYPRGTRTNDTTTVSRATQIVANCNAHSNMGSGMRPNIVFLLVSKFPW